MAYGTYMGAKETEKEKCSISVCLKLIQNLVFTKRTK
jgi:hypothetical protein